MDKRNEIEEAINTPFEQLTSRQNIIVSVYRELHSEENTGKLTRDTLEKMLIKFMRARKRGIITQQEYRDRVRIIELFYF